MAFTLPTLSLFCVLTVVAALGYTTTGYDDYDEYGGSQYPDYNVGDYEELGRASLPLSRHIQGIIDVDVLTFDKVVGSLDHSFVTFYKDTDHISEDLVGLLERVADKMGSHLSLLLAKIDVSGLDGDQLGARFGVKSTPSHVLYGKRGSYVGHVDLSDWDIAHQEELEAWLMSHAGPALRVAQLDPMVQAFTRINDRVDILERSKALVQGMSVSEAMVSKWYLKIMNNIIKKGDEYLQTEMTRIESLLKNTANLTPQKLSEFQQRRDVLHVFISMYRGEAASA